MKMDTTLMVEELIDGVEYLVLCQGVEVFKVTEVYTNGTKKSYLLRGLEIETENGIVIGSDMDDVLLDQNYVLQGFLADSVATIVHEKKLTFKICLKSGANITIEGIEE